MGGPEAHRARGRPDRSAPDRPFGGALGGGAGTAGARAASAGRAGGGSPVQATAAPRDHAGRPPRGPGRPLRSPAGARRLRRRPSDPRASGSGGGSGGRLGRRRAGGLGRGPRPRAPPSTGGGRRGAL